MKFISKKESENTMRIIIIVITASLTLLLCSCQTNESKEALTYENDIAKSQEITVISADTSEVIERITSKEDIEDFIFALNLDEWRLKKLPSEAAEIGSFGLSQEETIKFGQTDTDGTLYDIAKITLYEGSYISFEIGNLNTTFEVSEETANDLNEYFE